MKGKVGCILMLVHAFIARQSVADRTLRFRAELADVLDGNTIVLRDRLVAGLPDEHHVRLLGPGTNRLDGMQAPALDQAGGIEAKAALANWLGMQTSMVVVSRLDGAMTQGAWIYVGEDEVCVNSWMVEQGYAWPIEPRERSAISHGSPKQICVAMQDAYNRAKEQKRGIWALETLENQPDDEGVAFPNLGNSNHHDMESNSVGSAAESPLVVPDVRPKEDPPPNNPETSTPPGRNWLWWSSGMLVTTAVLGFALSVKRRK
jgi:endonuclease YncB( thermonuclease family)